MDAEHRWQALQGLGMVRAERRLKQEVTRETRYYLLSFPGVKTFAHAVRSHWGIGAIRFAEMSEKLKDGEQGGKNP